VFIDVNGNKWLFNKNVNLYRTDLYQLSTTIFKLFPGDYIEGDDPVTGNVFGFNNGVSFVILPNSTRA
jgi:hypothetical protein